MFIAPLMQLILFGYAATSDVRDIPLAVLDQDRIAAEPASDRGVRRVGPVHGRAQAGSEQELAQMIDAGAGARRPDHPARLCRRPAQPARARRSPLCWTAPIPSVASSALSSARLIGQVEATTVQQQALARRGGALALVPSLEVRPRVWYNPDMASAIFMVPALIGMILQMQATLLTSSAIVRERERGTIEQLIVTPIRPFELIVGKILPYALVALLITIEVLLAGTFWFGVPIKGSVLLLLGISCLFLLSTLGIGLLISTVANTQQEAFLLTFLTLLPSIFLSGFIYPIAAHAEGAAVPRAASSH